MISSLRSTTSGLEFHWSNACHLSEAYTYDELNRITQIAYPDETVTYGYDTCTNGVGRLCSITDNAGTTSYAYDLWGRVTSKSQTVGTLVQTMGYTYNATGQLATVTTPSGHAIAYGYANNRPVSVAVDGTSVLAAATYEPFGPIAGWTWGNSAPGATNTHARSFDKDFRLTHVRSDLPAAGAQALFDRQFSWDDQGRIGAVTDLANAALSASYGYDALDRLATGAQGASSWGYTYNGVGDRLTSSAGGSSTTYGLYPGTHRLQSLSGAQTKSYTYDGAGNLASDGVNAWTFAGNNRATQAGAATFLVNALGQRVKKTTATTATRFMYDEAGRLAGEYADDGTLVEETVWLADLPVATLRPNGTGIDIYYVHADQLGTPRMVTRPSDNQVAWRWDNTEPFGSSQPDENPSGLGTFAYNLRFPGQYFDVETATHYNYFRDYDPAIGRYVESDPIGLRGGYNTFAYVKDSPLGFSDVRGLAIRPICVANAFLRNFFDMKNANTINADKFFHCKANCEAARCSKGSDRLACFISNVREWVDMNIKRDPPNESAQDQVANEYGRGWGANTNLDCSFACEPFRPNGLGNGPWPGPNTPSYPPFM